MEIERYKKIVEYELGSYDVKLGAPLLDPKAAETDGLYQIEIPYKPHVFCVNKLRLEQNNYEIAEIDNVMVMLGHSAVTGEALEDWKFIQSGKSVNETVKAYERVQRMFNLPPIDVILACREQHVGKQLVKELFSYREFPYIVPTDNKVTLHNYHETEVRSWLNPGQGVGLLVADAGNWSGIERWESFWTSENIRERYDIPSWAVNASI